ncbi:ribosome-binding protein 1 isoform X2 [Anthonomus grandis grandis]|uniref:ribosome-binding protein 1 isoform X2 n=1 Tax=Anthonomus grandis grandis TaxID=2921223 RepID=UPI002166185E|nr:ribosome-binding protein 1 isoform X2 [Anthonomus grandis grandis]
MDLTTPLIFLSIFVLGSLSLFLVYTYGMKKKSYEEALAEHRKMTNALLGNKPKPNKEKKIKKATKKINKETKTNKTVENELSDDIETVDAQEKEVELVDPVKQKNNGPKGKSANKSKEKVHVEFKPEPEELPVEPLPVEKEVKEVINKKKSKKVRPILLKSTSELEIVSQAAIETPVLNHFEEIHPKDDRELLLMHAGSKEETVKAVEDKKPQKKNKQNRQEKVPEPQRIEKTETVAAPEPIAVSEELPVVCPQPVQEPPVNSAKEKKKKKTEFNSRQQMIAERDQLIHSVTNAELSRTEVQMLIDLLLNKQLEAPAVIDDWSEGKSDPVQKLKKQLADKEKQLQDEQEALLGVQAKLKEIRHEQQTERAQLQLKLKQSEEARADAVAARNRLQQNLQELEEFRSNFHRVVEENKALLGDRGRLEATLIRLQETDAVLHTIKSENAHLTNELHRLTQERQEQDLTLNNCLVQLQTMQEEVQRNQSFALSEQEETRQLAEKLQTMVQEEQRLNEVIAQLNAENVSLREENDKKLNGSLEESKEHKIKLLNLDNELSSVKNDLSAANRNLLEAERQHREEITNTRQQCEQLKTELEEQKNKNNEIRLREQTAHKQFLQRLFPEVEALGADSLGGEWLVEVEKGIRQHIDTLQKGKSSGEGAEVVKLQAEVLKYKTVIDETEGMLTNLESYIQQEERTLRGRLAEKDSEIQELKSHFSQLYGMNRSDSNGVEFAYRCIEQSLPKIIAELQIKVSSLEEQLTQEQSEKSRLLSERQLQLNRPESKAVLSESTATIEKLSEEVDRLKEQLRLEQVKNKEATRLVYQNGEAS